jgi:hypothetical protein
MWVTLASGYFQLVVWSVCTLPESHGHGYHDQSTRPGGDPRFAGVQTLFNFNP